MTFAFINFLFFYFILLSSPFSANASTSTLTLEITWNGKATDKVTIKETFTGLENLLNISGEIDLSFFGGQVGPDIRNNIVGEITVNNENGTPLSFRKTETEEGTLHWLISPGNSEEVIVSYEIAFKHKSSSGYLGAVLDNLLCGALEATFIVPWPSSLSYFPFRKGDIKIKFNTPSSLNIYTPWDFDGVYYYVWHQASFHLGITGTYYSFMSDSFAVGEFWEHSESVNGLNFVVIVSKLIPNLEQSDIDKIYDLSKDCLEYMNNVWGKSIGTKYLITYLPYHPDGNMIFVSEASASQGFTLLYEHGTPNFGAWLVHQMGHRWDGFYPFVLNMDTGDFSYYNFREGGTVYYEIKAGANIGYYRPIESEIRQYETIRGTPRDKPIALVHHGSGNPDDETIYYRKSPLVYYLLDKEIQTKTNHRKSLDDVSKGIYLEHGVYPGHTNPLRLTMTKYIEMVNNITGYDFHSFFDYYYYSVGDININSDLTSDPDGNGLTVYEEVLLNYRPPVFSDVPSDYWAYNYILAIYDAGITTGCAQDDPNTPENERRYCPEENVTRGQMAAFIVRAKYGESFTYTTTPYFSDVPSTHLFFKYVQKLKDDGITAVSDIYGVDNEVTRGQMAAFIIRAKHGENFTYTQTPYFGDVPTTHGFFKYVQKLRDDRVTTVSGTYGVDNIVTRAQMAAFLARAFLAME